MTNEWTPALEKEKTGGPLYLALLAALESDIADGRLAPQTRLPTHRELADRLGVAIGTVTRAYAEAEQRGLIRGEGRRGTFVGRPESGKSSLASLTEARPQTIDLSVNYPAASLDPDLPAALARLGCDWKTRRLMAYPPAAGLPQHRAAGSDWIKALGMSVDPDQIVVTAGAQHGLNIVFASIATPGDTVLAEEVTYPGIKATAEMLNLRLDGVPMDDEGLLPDALDALCKKRKPRALYCVPTLQNPTSVTMGEARRREIARIAGKHDLLIVEDEIHRRLVPKPAPLLASLAPERTFLVASPSKVVAGGLRAGFIAGPEEYRQELVNTLQATMVAVSPLSHEVLATWIEDGTAEKTIMARRREGRARQRQAKQVLGDFSMQAAPTSYYIWLELPRQWTRGGFVAQAQRRGVSVAPAGTFAVAGSTVPEAVRVSLGTAHDREMLQAGLEILADVLRGGPGGRAVEM